MASKFPESGLAAVLDLSQWSGAVKTYLKESAAMDQADAKSAKASETAAKAQGKHTAATKEAKKPVSDLTSGLSEMLGSVGLLPRGFTAATGGIGSFSSGAKTAVEGLTSMGVSVTSNTLLLGGLVVAATAASVALFKLGNRGATMPGLITAFDISSAKAGALSKTLLGDLRTASRGTVSDMQIMRNANVALAGATEETAKALGSGGGLAGLMEIARAQSIATGKDVDFLFESLVSGVKRSSPLLIDNTGLVLKVGDANEKYAAKIGKTVDALTAEEKQIALLNATLEAGADAVNTYGSGSLTAAERLAQISSSATNLLDRMAVSVQPLYTFVLGIGQTLLNLVIAPIQNVLVPIVYELSNAIFGPLLSSWETMTGFLSDVFSPVANLVHRWLVVIVGTIRLFGLAFQWVVNQAANLLGPFADIIRTYVVEPITKLLDPASFAQFAGNVFGAFASGIMWAANTLIFPAVIGIAEFIRDFLMGFSPPKKGPLSTIDKGGANVMSAWLEGFTGVSLTPVEQMAANVDAQLGSIGAMTYEQVADRLSYLDNVLQPFIDNLEIAKARMDALAEPMEMALDAVQKRLDASVQAFMSGGGSLEQVRALDRQNEALSRQLGMVEDMSAEAQYQLAIAQSRQTVERALLGIQQKRVSPAEQIADATKKTASAAGDVTSGSSGGGGSDDDTSAATSGGGSAWADLAQNDPVGSFLGVTDEDIAALWGDMSSGFVDGLDATPFADQLAAFEDNRSQLSSIFTDIGNTKPLQGLTDTFETVFGDGEDSLRSKVSGFYGELKSKFTEDIPGLFDGFSLGNLVSKFTNVFELDGPDSLRNKLSFFRTHMESVLLGEGDYSLNKIITGFNLDNLISTFEGVFGLEEGSLKSLLDGFGEKVKTFFKAEAGGTMYDALASIGGVISSLISMPMEVAANAFLGALEGMINYAIEGINTLISVWNQMPFGSSFETGTIEPITIKKIGQDAPGLRTGGSMLGGIARVHAGEMVVGSSSPYTVFPARWVNAMDRIADSVSTYAPPPSQTSAQPIVIDRGSGMTINQSFGGGGEPASVKRTMYELRALGVF